VNLVADEQAAASPDKTDQTRSAAPPSRPMGAATAGRARPRPPSPPPPWAPSPPSRPIPAPVVEPAAPPAPPPAAITPSAEALAPADVASPSSGPMRESRDVATEAPADTGQAEWHGDGEAVGSARGVDGLHGGAGGSDAGSELAVAFPPDDGATVGSYGAYLAGLRQRIQAALHYPPAARRRGLSGTVQLELTIRPDGAIDGVELFRSSSHAVLDEAALEAVRTLGRRPLPPPAAGRGLRVRLPVVFALY
jgi:protein TonB